MDTEVSIEEATYDLVTTILDAVTKFRRAEIALQTTTALQQKKIKGEKLGGVCPYGYTVMLNAAGKKVLLPHPEESAAVALMQGWHVQGFSLRKIGKKLEDRGIFNRAGRSWQAQTIKNILNYKRNDYGDNGK